MFKAYGVKKIITTCPHGYNTLKNEYPQWGDIQLEVHHHSEFLLDLVRRGRLKPKHAVDASLVYHDSCYLGRYNQIYDAPRELVDRIPGVQRAEVAPDRNRAKGMCCGAGGGRMWMEENRGQRINRLRVEQLTATGATTCATACPFCLVMVGDGLKETGRDEGYEAKDIAELLLTACGLDTRAQPAAEPPAVEASGESTASGETDARA
jgi:Fe-S oxidoreductase